MELRYVKYPKPTPKGFVNDLYLTMIEFCCPTMSINYRNKDSFVIYDGTLELTKSNWPIMISKDEQAAFVYHCPHCGDPVHVYIENVLYRSCEDLKKYFEELKAKPRKTQVTNILDLHVLKMFNPTAAYTLQKAFKEGKKIEKVESSFEETEDYVKFLLDGKEICSIKGY